MTLTQRTLLLAAAVICFAVAILVALGAIQSNEPAWQDGGLLALAASFLTVR